MIQLQGQMKGSYQSRKVLSFPKKGRKWNKVVIENINIFCIRNSFDFQLFQIV